MAKIRPFQAVRPGDNERAAEIAALPYDVVNTSEARAEIERHPKSFLRIDRAETNFPEGTAPYDRKVYAKAKELLAQMLTDGDYVREERPCYYLYELTMEGRTQTGIVAAASVDDYIDGIIKKHENTRAEKEQDRIDHVDTCSAQTGPIFLAYRNDETIETIVNRVRSDTANLLYDFTSDDGIRHRVFVISGDADIAAVTAAFDAIPALYIADGHHRAASAVKVSLKRRAAHGTFTGNEEYNYFLSVLFPDAALRILDYNRLVADLNGLSQQALVERISEKCAIISAGTGPEHPAKKGQFSLYLPNGDGSGTWRLFAFRPEDIPDDPVGSLDVSLLQEQILGPILGIGDPRTDPRIDFVGGIRGYGELMRRCSGDAAAAFALYPTSMDELFAVADAGLLMPPKSTWFEPKLRSGLFVHEIEE